jgi:DNA polymerase-3 subunit alpha
MLLNCHTYYSFSYGALSIEEFLAEISAGGYGAAVLADINNTSACIEFTRRADEFTIRPVVGIDFRDGIRQQFVGIARNNEGFRELNEFLTCHLHNKTPIGPVAPTFKNAWVVYPFSPEKRILRENEWIGVSPSDLKRLPFSYWKNRHEKMVILQTATFRNKRDYNIHRILRAIGNNTLLSKLPETEQAPPDELYLPKATLLEIYHDYPKIIENTQRLINQCSIDFRLGINKNKRIFSQSEEEDFEILKNECLKGLPYRYENPDREVMARLEKELLVIRDLKFCAYFLINWDIVSYARRNRYFYVGRGSGANSLVAYLLRITNVDPIELDLYFERFINPYRTSPPDFDIDFSWLDRDDVTRYIFERYGYDRTVLLGTYITYNHKSAIREVGKVFGLPDEEIVGLQDNPDPKKAGEYGQWVLAYSHFISGFPNQCSIHASGILVTEEPVSCYTATELMPKGFPSTQFDMHVAEDAGLHKFDILSQRGLGKIKDAVEIIRQNRGIEIDIDDIKRFKTDDRVCGLLRAGRAIGCFYIESPGMRMLLTKLKAGDYRSLVAASSIIRPGVASSGMMREYILRFQDEDRREKARKELPELYRILEDTYGVMVYQEDVLKVAHFFAGLTLDEADVLRRGMSWKFKQRNEFGKVKDRFFSNCREKKYEERTISEIWNQIESFANYAFAKGHSASYAVESFQALFLKAYFPLEYLVATLNNGGGFYRIDLYIHEARLHGAVVEAPCINTSDWQNVLVGNRIFIGFGYLKDLEKSTGDFILAERGRSGPFRSLRDFINRVPVTLEQLIILIRIGAFRFTGIGKKDLLWDAHFMLGHIRKTKPEPTIFNPEVKEFQLPDLWKHELEDAFDEIELLGFPLMSPFEMIAGEIPSQTTTSSLPHLVGKRVKIVGYLVHRKPTRAKNGGVMYFGAWLDLEGAWLDTVHFPPVARQYPFRGPGCYLIEGKVVEEYGYYSVEAEKMERLEFRNLDT